MEAATTTAAGNGGAGGGAAAAAASSSTTTTTTSSITKKEAGFGGWLQRVRRTGEFSDVVVRINGTTGFHLHMLPLRNASAFFRDELELRSSTEHSSSSSSSETQVVEIMELPGGAEAFSVAADFCYLIKPVLTFESVGGVRAVAEKLGMPDLVDTTKRFLYASVFSHWRSSVAFLERFKRLGSSAPSVDEYIESRCLKVVMAACTKAFAETKHVSVPIVPPKCPVGASAAMVEASSKCPVGASAPMRASKASICWQSSPCHSLTDVLVTVSSRLPDEYMAQLVTTLVELDVNLSIKCRQGRNVRAWLNHLLRDECATDRARCWILVCLATMLLKSAAPPIATGERSWMELSSQYWCSLLEHIGHHVALLSSKDNGKQQEDACSMLGRLLPIKASLEQRIGASLHELDDYLQSYRFSPATLLSLVRHFVLNPEAQQQQQQQEDEGYDEQQQLEEVAAEVDGCLWAFAEIPVSITAHEFVAIFSAFPASCRHSHDTLYASIERMLAKNTQQMFGSDDIQALWGLVDCDKLSPTVHEQALNNPSFLCQPHVLERVLRRHNEELATMDEHSEDRQNLRHIMQKVIKASLKLLEENNRRSKEIVELQKQYLALLGGGAAGGGGGGKGCFVYRDSSSCDNSPDVFQKVVPSLQNLSFNNGAARGLVHPDESAKGSSPEDDDEILGMVVAPQTPMPEARRSLHSMNLGEVLAS